MSKFSDKKNIIITLIILFVYTSVLLHAKKRQNDTQEISLDKTEKNKRSKAKEKRTKVVNFAENLLNSPYKYRGNTPSGFDCSGFTQYVFKKVNITMPHGSKLQSELGKKVKIRKVKIGDLLFFGKNKRKINHVAIVYSCKKGKLKFIHSTSSKGVIIDEENSNSWKYYWEKQLLFARRIIY